MYLLRPCHSAVLWVSVTSHSLYTPTVMSLSAGLLLLLLLMMMMNMVVVVLMRSVMYVQGVVVADLCTLVSYARHSSYLRQYVLFISTATYLHYVITGCVLTATGFVNGKRQFSTPQNRHPSTDHQKFVTGDYVGDSYGCVKFGAYPTGGFWAHGWNISKIIFIYTFLGTRIFTHDGSNDADSHKDVRFFGICSHCFPFRGSE